MKLLIFWWLSINNDSIIFYFLFFYLFLKYKTLRDLKNNETNSVWEATVIIWLPYIVNELGK